MNRNRMSVRNQAPAAYANNSYDAWEHTYFKHILDLHEIFMNDFRNLKIPDFDPCSASFLYTFGQFVRECSSGEISPYVDDLSEDLENFYCEYIIKRQEF